MERAVGVGGMVEGKLGLTVRAVVSIVLGGGEVVEVVGLAVEEEVVDDVAVVEARAGYVVANAEVMRECEKLRCCGVRIEDRMRLEPRRAELVAIV